MADTSGAAAAQAADAAQPQAGTTGTTNPPAAGASGVVGTDADSGAAASADIPAPAEETTPADLAGLRAELERTRREAAKNRVELKKAQDSIEAARVAGLSEEEKRASRLAALEKQLSDQQAALQERSTYATVVDAAARLGASKPQLIYRLLDHSAIEFDEAGAATNVDALVKEFLAGNPEFRSAAVRASGSADGGARPGISTLTRAEIDKMSPEEMVTRSAEIDAFMAALPR